MDIDEIKAAINDALPLRPPKWDKLDPPHPREKIELLEDYLLRSAYAQAELEEALHWLTGLVEHFKDKVAAIEGYEVALPNKRGDRLTQADINAAKRTVSPEVFECGAEARLLRETVLRQIERFRFEAQWVASRAYSMISGGS
jgi:hypothetical protein